MNRSELSLLTNRVGRDSGLGRKGRLREGYLPSSQKVIRDFHVVLNRSSNMSA